MRTADSLSRTDRSEAGTPNDSLQLVPKLQLPSQSVISAADADNDAAAMAAHVSKCLIISVKCDLGKRIYVLRVFCGRGRSVCCYAVCLVVRSGL